MGPATSFACPPLTLRATSSCVSTTYAVIAASSELSSSEESGRVLWVWQDDDSLRVKEKQKPKKSKSVVGNSSIEFCEQKYNFAIISFHPNKLHTLCSHVLNFLVALCYSPQPEKCR